MPIISRQLDYARPQADGTVRVRERHTDSKGFHHHARYRATSEAASIILMNARDLTASLQNIEETDAVNFIEAGGDPNAFVRVDLTAKELRRRLIKRFARTRAIDDELFMLKVATWVSNQNAGTLSSALSISIVKAQAIIDRATDMLVLKTQIEADDALVGEV